LPKLNEVEAFIAKNKHLPGSTSERDIMKNGMKITETAAEQQRHIEHLYLYVLELEKRLAKAETSISRQ
jgi:trimeric autotransporter adhesin